MTVRFESAWHAIQEIVATELPLSLRGAGKVVLLRDLLGRVHLALENEIDRQVLKSLAEQLSNAGGPFWSRNVLFRESMVAPDAVFDSTDAFQTTPGLWLLERSVTGAEWGRTALENHGRTPPRATLYGLKGGVGRSTTLAAWAWHLARFGRRVLVIDLDLESPGISSLLLPLENTPDFGVVDWFVEEAVNNADSDLVQQLLARSPLGNDTRGEILVAPCSGSADQDYMAKLARAYIDVPSQTGNRTFAERVAAMVDRLEEVAEPDVVLIDSRAGLHDLAAIATTRLNAMTFLFARAGQQTWNGYRTLLGSWAKHSSVAKDVRERVRVVAAQVPDHGRQEYLERLTQESYDAFAETLYEVSSPDQDPDAFNFDMNSTDAPHYPLRIHWLNALMEWDPHGTQVSYEELRAALGDFLDRATELTLGDASEVIGNSDLQSEVDIG